VGVATPRDAAPTGATSGGVSLVGKALPFGADAQTATSAISGNAVFTAWLTNGGQVGALGADLRTGKLRWRMPSLGRLYGLRGVIALPHAVLVVGSGEAGATAIVLDPRTGDTMWELPYRTADDLVYYDDLLVQQERATGDTRAFDWATGEVRWELRASADRPDRTLGMLVPEDAGRIGRFGIPMVFTDRRLVQIMHSGTVRVLDAGTGELRETRTAAATSDYAPVAFDGDLYTADRMPPGSSRYSIRVTALRGGANTRSLRTGSRLNAFAPCGDKHVCVSDNDDVGKTWLTSVGLRDGHQAWRASTPAGVQSILFLGEGILVGGAGEQALYAADGRRLAVTADTMGRLDSGSVLVLPDAAGKEIVRLAAKTGERREIGPMPVPPSGCTWAVERLACAGDSGLRIWSLPR
jgi:outer membrane protein assembly factor BamB